MKNIFICIGVIIFIYVIYRVYRVYKYQTLDDGLSTLIEKGTIILDVRTEKEFATGHMPDSQNISLGTIRERYTELYPTKTYIIV